MSGEEKNRVDELFKKGLENASPDLNYHEPDWDAMEQLLDAHKKPRGVIYWLPRLGAVAAILLAFLGWWFFKPEAVNQQQMVVVKQKPAAIPAVVNTDTIAKSAGDGIIVSHQPKDEIKNKAVSSGYAGITRQRGHKTPELHKLKPAVNPVVQEAESPASTSTEAVAMNTVPQKQVSPADSIANVNPQKPVTVKAGYLEALTGVNLEHDQAITPATEEPAAVKVKKTGSKSGGYKPQFGLTVLASPDVNGVGSFRQSQIGANIGLVFSVSITPKLSVSTGASYSRKPYETDFSNYHTNYQFYTDPNSVYADCRVLDIPLNVDYKLYNKNRNSFSVGSGLSSYIMLKEHYTYNYDTPAAGPAGYTVVNRNQHILGVLNLNATYQRALNSRFSLAAEPYLKIPLTNIGSSQVRLQSAGVAVGFKWNLNQSVIP